MSVEWAIGRLQELRAEYAGAEGRLVHLDRERVQLQDTLLRIGGAIAVLEELIAGSGTFDTADEAVATRR